MKIVPTPLAGAAVIEPERLVDARGFFSRTVCRDVFTEAGLKSDFVQSSVSYNVRSGTLRGMHFQTSPHAEAKLVRCTRGAIFDVIIDLRRESKTCGHWYGVELSDDNPRALYVPEFFAHGFITLHDQSEVLYQMTEPYAAGAASGVRWDDPAFAIAWPFPPTVMSERDRSYPDYAK